MPSVTLHVGDCREALATMPDASVDSIVTDPPYELGFMGKTWDSSGIAYSVEMWTECLRVLKPGGHLLAFGGTRTYHRMAVAIEDAGFEIRDSIHWIYGSGFPKSLDVSKAIDKVQRGGAVREKLLHFAAVRGVDGRWLEARGVASASSFADWTVGGHVPSDRNWQIVKDALGVTPEEEAAFEREVLSERPAFGIGGNGVLGGHAEGATARVSLPATPEAAAWSGWGTALKPAHEPIVVARKPLVGTVAANVLAHGTGALNIDGCRVAATEGDYAHPGNNNDGISMFGNVGRQVEPHAAGRWPANVIFDEAAAAELDAQSGTSKSVKGRPRGSKQSGEGWGMTATGAEYDDSGGASRFFYCAKAGTKERPVGPDGTKHATVKPLALMRYLVRLVTPPGGTVLDPFAGSGTTLEAAILEGFDSVGIERDPAHADLCAIRVERSGGQWAVPPSWAGGEEGGAS